MEEQDRELEQGLGEVKIQEETESDSTTSTLARVNDKKPERRLLSSHMIARLSVFEGDKFRNQESQVDAKFFPIHWKMPSPNKDPIMPIAPDISDEEYPMNHKNRGKALIFNHFKYSKKNQQSERKGAEVDAKNLQAALKKLEFDVILHENLKKDDLLDTLNNVATEDHTDEDCLLVVVMSHGDLDFIHAYDGIYDETRLWKPFTSDRCPSLAGKPKLFFIQACRGKEFDDGTEVQMELRTQTDGPSKKLTYTIPNTSDILIAHATFPGHFAWRNPETGSWFIEAFCKQLNKRGTTHDIIKILTAVNRNVAIAYESNSPERNKKKQMSNFFSTLTRDLYFRPKNIKKSEETIS